MITALAWYQTRQGQSLLVPGQPESNRGQCAQSTNYALNEIYGLPYHYGNAIDWWTSPKELLNNFDKVSDGSVKAGDFVVFNQQVGSVYGHIDIALQDGSYTFFKGGDSNWAQDKTLHVVVHNNPNWVLGTLRYKGTTSMVDENFLNAFYWDLCNRNPSEAEKKLYLGRPYTEAYDEIRNGQEHKDIVKANENYKKAAENGGGKYSPYNGASLYTKG